VATVPDPKNALQVVRLMRDRMEARTGITNYDRDSKARVLLDNFTEEALSQREEAVTAYEQSQLSNAVGENLRQIGLRRGVQPLERAFANVADVDQNLAFFVSSGTIAAINGGGGITVTRGTRVSADANQLELGSSITFILTEDLVLASTDSVGFASARAEFSGSGHNIGSGVLRTHDFTNYVQAAAGTLKVTNFFPIMNGRDTETDEHYRFRIARNYNRLVSSNEAKTQLLALRVPGVLETKHIPGYFGIGTTAVVVLGADYQSNTDLVDRVQARLFNVMAPGTQAIAMSALSVEFDLELNLTAVRTLTALEKMQLEQDVRRGLYNYFRSLQIGGTVTIDDMSGAIRQQARGLLNVRRQSETGMFDRIFVRRGYSNAVVSEREQMISQSYSLENIEYADLGTITFRYN
jgi:uncharacterized phage protein gp47/JayE